MLRIAIAAATLAACSYGAGPTMFGQRYAREDALPRANGYWLVSDEVAPENDILALDKSCASRSALWSSLSWIGLAGSGICTAVALSTDPEELGLPLIIGNVVATAFWGWSQLEAGGAFVPLRKSLSASGDRTPGRVVFPHIGHGISGFLGLLGAPLQAAGGLAPTLFYIGAGSGVISLLVGIPANIGSYANAGRAGQPWAGGPGMTGTGVSACLHEPMYGAPLKKSVALKVPVVALQF